MRNWLILVGLLAMSLIPFSSIASQWNVIGSDLNGNTWAVDTSSIVFDGNTVRAWIRIDFKETQPYPPNGELIKHVNGLNVINCVSHQIGTKASRLLRADGSLIAAHEDTDSNIKWQTVAPDTVLEKTTTYICSFATKTVK